MLKRIFALFVLSLFLTYAGVSIAVAIAFVMAATYQGLIHKNSYTPLFTFSSGVLLDLFTLNRLGTSALIFLMVFGGWYVVAQKFKTILPLSFGVGSVIALLVYFWTTAEPVKLYEIVMVITLSYLLQFLLNQFIEPDTIRIRTR